MIAATTANGRPAVSDLIAPDAVISLIAARIRFSRRDTPASNAGLRLTSPRMLATMAPGLPFDIAAQFAYPNRQSIAVVGDGGFAMFMAELNTAVQHRLPIKIIVLKNNSLSEVRFEQKDLGYPNHGCDLAPIDFVAFAKACGAAFAARIQAKFARRLRLRFARLTRRWRRLWSIQTRRR